MCVTPAEGGSEPNTTPPADIETSENDNTSFDMAEADNDKGYDEGLSTVRWEDRKPQVLQLCKELWPDAGNHQVLSRLVGSYNETITITITSEGSDPLTDFILRIPNQWSEIPVIESVAILHYVRCSTPIRVPSIIAYDVTTINALESPYIVMERLRGRDLDDLLDDLTPEQRVVIASELAQVYTQLRQVKLPYSGRIVPAPACHLPRLRPGETLSQMPIAIAPLGARTYRDVMEKGPLAAKAMTSDPPNLSLGEMFKRAFDRRILQQTTWYPRNKAAVERFTTLQSMAATIVAEGYVENDSNEFCLWHTDLFPRNIIIDVDSRPMITGIVDWDEAVFAPTFVTAVAPAWLWESGPRFDEDGDYLGPDDVETAERSNCVPESEQMRAVKSLFEDKAGDEYRAISGDPLGVIARRLVKFAATWQWPDWWFDLYYETLDEWAEILAGREYSDEFEVGSDLEIEEGAEDDGDSVRETDSESVDKE